MLSWLLLLVSFPVLLAIPWPWSIDGHYSYHNISQSIDHFNASDTRTFLEYYQLYDGYFKPGGPIIFLVGPENGLFAESITYSSMAYFASALNGLILASEHRYYGESLPFGADSFTIPNLRYLTVENALADYVALLQQVKSQVLGASNSPVITFGGSYGGFLSASIRAKYPSRIFAAVASAAPVFLASAAADTWYDEVAAAYQNANATCASQIGLAFAQLYEDTFVNSNYSIVQSKLLLCEAVTPFNAGLLFMRLKNCFSTIIQFNYPLRDVLCDGWPMQTFCSRVPWNNAYGLLREAINTCYNITPTPLSCLDFTGQRAPLPPICTKPWNATTAASSASLAPTSQPPPVAYDPWLYESCTEFVMPVSGTGMFAFNIDWTMQYAQQACTVSDPGAPWQPLPPLINATDFSGINFTNVIFTNHAYDPVRGFTPNVNVSDTVIAINVDMSGHCLDLMCMNPYNPFSADPLSVIEARQVTLSILSRWLSSAQKE